MKTSRRWNARVNLELRTRASMLFTAFLFVWVQCLAPWTGAVLHAEETAVAKSGEAGFQVSIPPHPVSLIIPATLGNRKELLFLDTGAGITMLDLSLKDLAPEKLGTSSVVDAEGLRKPLDVFRGPDLTIQSLHRSASPVLLADLRMVSTRVGLPVKGILGVTDLSAGTLLIDRETNFVVFHHGQWRLHASTATEIPLLKDQRTPHFEGVFGGKACQLLVDTGYDGCVSLTESLFEALVASGDIERSMRGSVGESMFSGPLKKVGKNGAFLRGELMGKSLAGVNVSSGGETNMIGLAWLHGFSIEIDFPERRMRYKRLPDAAPPANIHRMLGAAIFFPEGGPVVTSLKPGGGPAQEAGIEVGDKIDRFGEIPGKALNAVTLYEAIQKNAGKDLKIALRRGTSAEAREVTVKLSKLVSRWSEGENP